MDLYAGFDLGGTRLKYGLVDWRGRAVHTEEAETPDGIDSLLALLEDIWKGLRQKGGNDIRAAGFGFAGIFSLRERKILQSPNYPGLDDFDLVPALSRFIRLPIFIHNDANMAAFGEFRAGAGRGTASLILLTIGTGVGGGVILDGRLWEGACGFAGEIGHAVVNPEGDRCNCGGRGCLETEVSAAKIVAHYRKLTGFGEAMTAEDVCRRAEAGDAAARAAFEAVARFLGIALGSFINLLNPELVLLGGGVMEAGGLLLEPAAAEARKRSFRAAFECSRIERASLGNKAGFLGAALWAKEQIDLRIRS